MLAVPPPPPLAPYGLDRVPPYGFAVVVVVDVAGPDTPLIMADVDGKCDGTIEDVLPTFDPCPPPVVEVITEGCVTLFCFRHHSTKSSISTGHAPSAS